MRQHSRSLAAVFLAHAGFLAFATVLPFFQPSSVLAEDACSKSFRDIEGKSTLGSASTWANLRGSEESIKAKIKVLLDDAAKGRSSAQAPESFCPTGCDTAKEPMIVFRSIPNKFNSDSSDDAQCRALFTKTKQNPLKYSGNKFGNLEDLNSWFGDFSQGKGKQGGDLYDKCPGDCSPQYFNTIDITGKSYVLNSDVICGPARDKSDNQYKLSVAYRWTCITKG